MRSLRIAAGALALFVALAGCGLVPDPSSSGPTRRATENPSDVVTKSLADVERFWTSAFPKIAGGRKFQAVRGGYHPYTERKLPPDCGGQAAEYQPNAFYCPDGDYIAWDAQKLIPELQEDFGPLLVGVVMAHEYGHAVQARLGGTDQPTVVLEQQADCFAGAWLAGRSSAFKATPAELDDTVAGILMLRDQPGTPAVAEGAHGNAFDRVRAFQEGVEQGAKQCAGYDADNLPVTEVPFSTEEEAASGGELPYEKAVNLLAEDAEKYWERTLPEISDRQWRPVRVEAFDAGSPPECDKPDAAAEGAAFYCPSSDLIAFDNTDLGPTLYDRIGDYAVGMLLGDLFARAAQSQLGASTGDKAGQLTVDCLAGSWTNDLLTREDGKGVRLSPGDLDEAVAALIAFGRAGEGGPTAFERISSYRMGVLEGYGVCV